MSLDVSERNFEDTIERALLAGGPDAEPGSEPAVHDTAEAAYAFASGGYRKRTAADYDRILCLIPRDVLDFIYATQPKT